MEFLYIFAVALKKKLAVYVSFLFCCHFLCYHLRLFLC